MHNGLRYPRCCGARYLKTSNLSCLAPQYRHDASYNYLLEISSLLIKTYIQYSTSIVRTDHRKVTRCSALLLLLNNATKHHNHIKCRYNNFPPLRKLCVFPYTVQSNWKAEKNGYMHINIIIIPCYSMH